VEGLGNISFKHLAPLHPYFTSWVPFIPRESQQPGIVWFICFHGKG